MDSMPFPLYTSGGLQLRTAPANWWTLSLSMPMQQIMLGLKQKTRADYVGLKAEDADSGRGGELHLVAVAQFQEQLTALALWPRFETDPHELQKPEELGFHCSTVECLVLSHL